MPTETNFARFLAKNGFDPFQVERQPISPKFSQCKNDREDYRESLYHGDVADSGSEKVKWRALSSARSLPNRTGSDQPVFGRASCTRQGTTFSGES
jgi:hypothetical protein